MKKEVFCFILILALSARSDYLGSDLSLINDRQINEYDTVDPYWNLAWHGRVASYGDPDSQFFVAQVYEQGRLVPQNISTAVDYYRKAAAQDHIEAIHRLAQLIPSESEKWYKLAADLGDPQAQLKLSQFYEEQGDIENAILYLERALKNLFPGATDLEAVSPDLKRLKESL